MGPLIAAVQWDIGSLAMLVIGLIGILVGVMFYLENRR